MRKATALAMIGAVSLVTALVGCSGGDAGGDSGTGETVHLVFRQFDPASEVTGLQKAVDAWNAKHPDIQVDMQTLSPNNVQQFAREANSGSGPDVAQVAFADVAFLAKPKILTSLDALEKKSPVPGGTENLLATDMTTVDGKSWALPWTADTMALVYRPDSLKDAGISKPPTTWEQLAKDATKISKDSGGKTAGFCFGASGAAGATQWFALNYYLWSHDATLVQKSSSGDWKPGVSKGDLADAIDFFDGLFASGATPKSFQSVNDYSDPSIATGMATGSCAMTYEPPQTFRALAATAKDQVTTAPMPSGLTDGATHLGGRALALNRNSKHPEQAWEFMKYLVSATTFKTYAQYPASSATLDKLDVPESEKGFTEQLPHSRSFARYIGSAMPIASMQQLVNQELSAVYSGQKSSDAAAGAILDGLSTGIAG
jgi:multiple sugar transport system substrate-binding protein